VLRADIEGDESDEVVLPRRRSDPLKNETRQCYGEVNILEAGYVWRSVFARST